MEDNVIETQAGAVAGATADAAAPAAEKPVRKRASRRVTAPAGEAVAPVKVEAPAAAAVEASTAEASTAAAPAAADAAVEAEAPKKRVTRSRKKVAEAPAESAEVAAAPAEAAVDAAVEADSAGAEAPAEAPKKRVTRSRKKVAEAPADEAAVAETEAGTAPAADAGAVEQADTAEEPVKKPRRARATKASKAAEAEAAQTAPEAAEPAETQNETAEAPQQAAANGADESAKADAAGESAQTDADKSDADKNDADKSDADKPARGRTRSRRGQKQDAAETAEAAQPETESNDSKSQNQKNQRGQKNGESQNGPESNKQGDKNGETRSSRTRQRDRKRRGQGDDLEPEISEDDVLLPIAGILDVLDNYAFVRTSGYLPGTSDVYVSLGQVKKYGMKRGDAIVGAIRQPREGEQAGRQKYNAIVRVDSVNGRTLEENEKRVEFAELSAIYPERQLKLDTGAGIGREIDAAAPVGFGQRGLLVVPKPARGVEVLSQLAAAVSANAPEAHLMLLLTNAQPEDITHLSRTVNGEVVAASFERPAEDQATVAELGIDRARRLAELGHDVVVLIDSVGDLARAYAQAQPVSARPAHGAIDEFAVTQVRRVLGAARNAENAGSLTVLATAAAKTGVASDKQLLRDLRPVANSEIRFVATAPAKLTVDAERSHTRGAAALQPTSAA